MHAKPFVYDCDMKGRYVMWLVGLPSYATVLFPWSHVSFHVRKR